MIRYGTADESKSGCGEFEAEILKNYGVNIKAEYNNFVMRQQEKGAVTSGT